MTRNLVRSLRLLIAPAAMWLASLSPVAAQELFNGWGGSLSAGCESCATSFCCQTHHCPPPLAHCQERPPIIRVKCGCPKPICNPCTQPGWGYFETCWSPWPWPPNYNHCATLPPAATVVLDGAATASPYYNPNEPGLPDRALPPVRPMPGTGAPSMPPTAVPPSIPTFPTTPAMPRIQGPMPQTIPQSSAPIPGGNIDNLPTPRNSDVAPRQLPSPGGAF
jgi:hypothetical protein